MKYNKAFKYRIYPNNEQKTLLAKIFGCARFVYNHYLALSQKAYEETGKRLTYKAGAADLVKLKEEKPFLKEADSMALQQAIRHLDQAYKNHFKNPDVFKLPTFKSKKDHKYSYSTPLVNNSIWIEGREIRLPKIGVVRTKQRREIPEGYKLKSATVSKTSSGKYYVSLLYEYHAEKPKIPNPDHVVGLDFSIPELYVSANNIDAKVTHYYEQSLAKLAREERKQDKCEFGSKNYGKQRTKVARIHEKIANQRRDYLQKKTTQIANAYDAICIEDLSIPELVEDLPYRPVHRTIYDDGWGMFRTMLEYKMEDRGKYLLKADKEFPSSKRCHCCGHFYSELKLGQKRWTCSECHTHHDRDKNAAFNLKAEGERLLKEMLTAS